MTGVSLLSGQERLRATLLGLCVLVLLAVTTPCAMALAQLADLAGDHDCPHCPPQPCHAVDSSNECDNLDSADKPRQDSGAEMATASSPAPGEWPNPVLRVPVPPVGPPPARDGPRRHLLLVTFNE